jgi:hypothetical protein
MLEPFRLPSIAVPLSRRRGIQRPTRQAPPDAAPGDGAPPAGPQVCLLFRQAPPKPNGPSSSGPSKP